MVVPKALTGAKTQVLPVGSYHPRIRADEPVSGHEVPLARSAKTLTVVTTGFMF